MVGKLGWLVVSLLVVSACDGGSDGPPPAQTRDTTTYDTPTGLEPQDSTSHVDAVPDGGGEPDAVVDVAPDKTGPPDVVQDATPDLDQDTAPDTGPDVEPDTSPGPAGTPLTFRGWSPFVQLQALGQGPLDFVIDTGSPVTVFDTDVYGGANGTVSTDAAMFGASWAVDGVRFNVFGSPPDGAKLLVGGILGGDFLTAYALTVDFREAQGWLWEDLSGDPPLALGDVGATVVVPVDLDGGGSFGIPGGGGSVSLGPTRIVVDAVIEGTPIKAVVDTGASHSLMGPSLLATLGDGGRPVLSGVEVTQSGSAVEAELTRVATLSVGGATVDGATVIVMPDDGIFGNLKSETGQDVKLLLGGTFLRHFLTTFDTPNDVMRLAPYTLADHLNPNEWIGPGFTIGDGPGGDFIVLDVYAGTSAAAAGVQKGWRLAQMDGTATADHTVESFRYLITTYAPGTSADFGFRDIGDGTIDVVPITIEDLLPAYP